MGIIFCSPDATAISTFSAGGGFDAWRGAVDIRLASIDHPADIELSVRTMEVAEFKGTQRGGIYLRQRASVGRAEAGVLAFYYNIQKNKLG